jgi:required for meiotic nuclear division protein 1
METLEFKSSVISNELDITEIAKHFGISKKFKWDEPLVLNEKCLKGVIPHPENKFVFLFNFGSMVAVNLTMHEIKDVLEYLKKHDRNIKPNSTLKYIDDYKLLIDEKMVNDENDNLDFVINYDCLVVRKLERFHTNILATILAKSAAFDKVESDIDVLLDELENVISMLDKGHLKINDRTLSIMSGKILRFKYSTISNIMILEKPDVAWANEDAEGIFVELTKLFELKERYEKMRHKTEVLMDITEVFSSLTHAKRGNKLEWLVIILIFFELILSLIEKFIR